jgi:hypothetical protein
MNYHIWKQLGQKCDIHLIQKINPPVSLSEKALSKLRRSFGLQGTFTAFDSARLKLIQKLVDSAIDSSATFNFFHGSTSWLHVRREIPYELYVD